MTERREAMWLPTVTTVERDIPDLGRRVIEVSTLPYGEEN